MQGFQITIFKGTVWRPKKVSLQSDIYLGNSRHQKGNYQNRLKGSLCDFSTVGSEMFVLIILPYQQSLA